MNAQNPGLRIYMAKLKRPPIGYAGGSSGIHIKPSHKGLFTAKAKGAGKGVQQYAQQVLAAPKGRYPASTRKQANFARNAATKFNK